MPLAFAFAVPAAAVCILHMQCRWEVSYKRHCLLLFPQARHTICSQRLAYPSSAPTGFLYGGSPCLGLPCHTMAS